MSMMTNEQCFSLAVENLLNIEVPERAKWIRGKARLFHKQTSIQKRRPAEDLRKYGKKQIPKNRLVIQNMHDNETRFEGLLTKQ